MQRVSGLLSQLGWPVEMHPMAALHLLGNSLHAQASMLAFRDVFLFLGMCFFFAMLPAILLRERKPKARLAQTVRADARPAGSAQA